MYRSPRNPLLYLAAALLMLFATAVPCRVHAAATVFVGEPFGRFGTMMPLGHTAVYLDQICADGPLKLRHCRPGEPQGVVLARYAAIRPYDWLATPVRQFLYATDDLREIPAYATPEIVWAMRQHYRERYLRSVVPDGTEGHFHQDGRAAGAVLSEWWETAGMAYNRRVWAYQVATTPDQDQRVIDAMNADPNRHIYHLKKTNCADFAAVVMNMIYPGAVHNDRIGDFGLMTPKQVVRSLSDYAAAHPELDLHVYEVPQIPGSLRRSRPVRGGAESGLKTKRYLFTLAVIQPEVPIGLAVLYLWHGRWQIGKDAQPLPGLTREPNLLEAAADPASDTAQPSTE